MHRKTFTFEGKRYSVSGTTREALYTNLANKKRALEEGRFILSKNMLIDDWINDWLRTYKQNNVNEKTYKDYLSRIANYILPVVSGMRVRDIKHAHIQEILNLTKGLSRDRINKIYLTTSQILKAAESNKLILETPVKDIEIPKGGAGTHRAITAEERATILKVAEYHRAGLWVLLMLYCGLRPGETARVQVCHFDFNNKTLYVDGTKTVAAQRTVPVPEVILKKINSLNKSPFDFIFTKLNGDPFTPTSRTKAWRSFKREMNISLGCRVYRSEVVPPFAVPDDLVPYCLRHTFCTDLQNAGVPINVAKELMGHTNISTTSKIYTHFTPEALKSAADALDVYRNA